MSLYFQTKTNAIIGKLLQRNIALILAEIVRWFEKGLIEAKDDIADYYLNLLKDVNPSHLTLEKVEQIRSREYDSIFNKLKIIERH